VRTVALLLCVAAMVFRPAPCAGAVTYKLVDLGTLAGDSDSAAYAINDNGQIVGDSYSSSTGFRAFLWHNGAMADLHTSDVGGETHAYSINERGQIAGSVGSSLGIVWYNEATTVLWGHQGYGARAYSINDSGQVVGWSYSGGGFLPYLWQNGSQNGSILYVSNPPDGMAYCINNHAQVVGVSVQGGFLWDGGTGSYLGYSSQAYSINESGQIVGSVGNGACRWQNGVVTVLGPGCARAINDIGQIVGYGGYGNEHAFLWQKGAITDLGTLPGAEYSQAYGINSNGWIVGESGGHAVLWQPVPEPSSLLALLCRLGGMAGIIRYRRR